MAAVSSCQVAGWWLHHAVVQQQCPIVTSGNSEKQEESLGECGEIGVGVEVCLPHHAPKKLDPCGIHEAQQRTEQAVRCGWLACQLQPLQAVQTHIGTDEEEEQQQRANIDDCWERDDQRAEQHLDALQRRACMGVMACTRASVGFRPTGLVSQLLQAETALLP